MNLNDLKMVIVMRKDLNMRRGKMVAQGSHGILNAYINSDNTLRSYWKNFSFEKKICVSVNSESELYDIFNKCIDEDINVYMVRDLGFTEFKEETDTCLAIGPDYSEKIDKITGKLPLL